MIEKMVIYIKYIVTVLLSPLMILIPRNKHKIVFGSWYGRQCGCNPKYLMLYLIAHHSEYKCVWVGEEKLRSEIEAIDGVVFARKGSLSAWYHCLTARFFASNIDWREDIGWVPRANRTIWFSMTHGVPNKCCGVRQLDGSGKSCLPGGGGKIGFIRTLPGLLRERINKWMYPMTAYGSLSSKMSAELVMREYPDRFSVDRVVLSGFPRNDFLVNNKHNDTLKTRLREKYSKFLGVPLCSKWYLYAPTWRHGDGVPFAFSLSKRKCAYEKILSEQNAILIDKQHPKTFEKVPLRGGMDGHIYTVPSDVSSKIDTQELLICCDRLISDYSSIYFDFALLDRPVIHWTYDYDFAQHQDFGFEYDLREYGTGPFVYDEEQLAEVMRQSDDELLMKRGNTKWRDLIDGENGDAGESYVRLMEALA